jgi:hypothetical protein
MPNRLGTLHPRSQRPGIASKSNSEKTTSRDLALSRRNPIQRKTDYEGNHDDSAENEQSLFW